MQILKPAYEIDPYSVDWVYNVPNTKVAYSIWVKRFDRLVNEALKHAPHGGYWNRITDLEVEMYERCAALRWPQTIKPTLEQEWLSQVPPGSFIQSKGGSSSYYPTEIRRRLINNGHKNFIGYY